MADVAASRAMTREERKVVFASSLGTVFEWYDFYLYGTLATIIARQFFSPLDAASAFVFALLAFVAGFIVRPFGALLFGRLGDMIGRKYTFLVTILIMGLSTFIVGILPTYGSIGVAAPVILVGLRLLQGLAMGGEYGGAAIYVAEHAPRGRLGAYTAWIQTTATLGLFMSLLVILGTRMMLGEAAFAEWGWRIPFLVSIVLLGVSVWIRLSLDESPAFRRLKAQGRTSPAPVSESFGRWKNLRVVLLALVGLTAGQAVVWYTGQFYALFFLTQQLKVDTVTAQLMVAAALLIGLPFFIVFGAMSDRVGRKPIIMLGCALAAATYFPAFQALAWAANPALAEAQARNRVVLVADPTNCSFQFNPTGVARFTTPCDLAKQMLAAHSVSYSTDPTGPPERALIRIGATEIVSSSVQGMPVDEARRNTAVFRQALGHALADNGYPTQADPARIHTLAVVAIISYLMVLVAMVYGPIAAMLVEMFPTRIRYTSMSLPYHIGNGWFGGLLPPMSFAIVAQTGNVYSGLWYPVVVAAVTAMLGTFLLRETKDVDIYARD
ncbi:MFS transporter [Acidovorax sp.]|uniref:MFS transporter n=1 Tax=Acidovorax sp. TaxID=1872122 RepID=UPI002ACE5E14|nr:MFS transporter [Acidovorax sp.]MDZ7867034.1 MFS transporter [Acidovorax sp.]